MCIRDRPETDPTAPTQSAGLEQTQPVTEPSIAAQEPTTPPSTEPNVTDPPITDPPITEPDPTEPPPETDPPRTCSIAIYCDTILNNWDSLEPEKAGYVPSDGVLLYPITVCLLYTSSGTGWNIACTQNGVISALKCYGTNYGLVDGMEIVFDVSPYEIYYPAA